jgi:hypothetical protein
VEILLKIYAKCLDGGGQILRQRIQTALGHAPVRSTAVKRLGPARQVTLSRPAPDERRAV